MVKPNFFIIGAPKCGTTALSEYLRHHPNVFLSTPKEPHYFDFDFSHTLTRDEKTYLSLFNYANPEVHLAIGEASVSYLFSTRAVDEILKFNPDAKFIVMLRNPVELVQSLHSEALFNGIENIADFKVAWGAEPDRKNGKKIPLSCSDRKLLLYSEWGKLGGQVERLFFSVQKDRVKVIVFDDFAANPQKVYEETLSFLNVPSDGRKEFPRINEGKKITWPWFQQFLAFLYPKIETVKKLIGIRKGFGIFSQLLIMNSRSEKRKDISKDLRTEIRNFYREDVAKLSNILGRDFSHWTNENNLNLKKGALKAIPNFFIVGASKCGTTAMSEYLKDHPNIFMSSQKEPQYFDTDLAFNDPSVKKINLKAYLSLFGSVNKELHKAIGEASPTYLYSKCAVEEILKFNPKAKFIVMLRNPVEMAQSLHAQQVFMGVEDILDFEKAWHAEKDRKNGQNIPHSCLETYRLLYSERCKLGDQLEKLVSVVPPEKLKIILFDDFSKDTKRIYDETLAFLDIPSDHRSRFQIINENKILRWPALQQNLSTFNNRIRIIGSKAGIKIGFGLSLFPKLFLLNSKASKRAPLSNHFRAELVQFFQGDIQKISKLLNRDLTHWAKSKI